ncbi:MAG: hypothetical protein WA594_09255, partial [Candidatus Sulfotelmatobacter sp.]
MNRRDFISHAVGAVVAGAIPARASAITAGLGAARADDSHSVRRGWSLALDRHRFGVNYTPSKNWWFCWN